MNYKVLEGITIKARFKGESDISNGLEDLEEKVNAYIKQGWKPQGGISVVLNSNYNLHYYQAMIK